MVYSIEYNLQAYRRELSDLEYIINEDLETRTFVEQADKISDLLSGRFMVHFRMGDARDTAEELLREVSSPLPMIDHRKEELKEIEEKLTRNLNEYIENV